MFVRAALTYIACDWSCEKRERCYCKDAAEVGAAVVTAGVWLVILFH